MEEKSNSEAGELTTPRSASSQGEKDKGKKDKHQDKKHKEKKEKEKKEKKDKKGKKDDKPLPDVVPISDAQRTAIGVFKERVKEYIKPHHTDDTFIRFLRARNFDLEKSAEMFINSMKWREEFGADNILDSFRSNPFYDVLTEYWPSATHGLTKDGWPVYFERIGQVDARGLLKAVSEKDLLHYHVFTVERDEKRRAQLFAERGVYPGTVIVQDCQGLGWKHLYRPAIGVLQKLFKMDQDNYPESLRKMYVVNAPKLFTVVYAMVKPLVDPRTLQKVIVLGSSFKEELLKVMDEDQLPKVLGGSCKMHEGECMPKGGKFPDVKRGASTVGDDEDSETFEVTIASQDKHEHEVKIDDDESVLAWQFKTENHNIGFAVFRKVDNNAREAILEHQKYDAHEEVIENSLPVTPGHYILHWDNTFSRFRKKQLTYSVMVTSPKSERKDEPVTDPLVNTNAVDSAVVQTEKKD